MSNAIEIEAKALIGEADYEKLRKIYKDHPSYTQTNYYIDDDSFLLRREGFALRVREKEGLYEMTLKTPLSQGLLEKNCPWSKATFDSFSKDGIFPEGDIKRFLTMLDIDVASLKIKTSLTTCRIDVPYLNGKLSIDKNEYSGRVDYEVELEFNNMRDAESNLKDLLEKNGIKYSLSRKTKVERALDAIKG